MKIREIKTTVHEFDTLSELEPDDRNLAEKAQAAAAKAYAPYSGFKVGASVQLANGETFEGNNQENAAYPSGICAERVAISSAAAEYPDVPITTIAIAAITNAELTCEAVSPCGFCRQVMVESEMRFSAPMRVILRGKERIRLIESARQLLPLVFDRSLFMG